MPKIRVTFLGTGAGASIHRAHTAIVLDLPDGTRLLLDASSGNSVMRNATQAGMQAQDFHHILLSHHHGDHMSGLTQVQLLRTRALNGGSPLEVYSTGEALEHATLLFQAIAPGLTVGPGGAVNAEGRQVVRWNPVTDGQIIELGPDTRAWSFPADHISGAIGWRIESDGAAIVFSGDTRFNPKLVEAARGARLLIHEAYGTEDDREGANRVAHSTAGDAGRSAALAGVEELVLTHITNPFHADTQPLIDEARQQYEGPVSTASDLHQLTVETG
ncbi:MAG: MBL fold metallo-hydrolase [Chloroflexi bacterium]|nr:MBL fold metallo-hydrolase [Chloroflexota bacterium]